MSLNKPFFSVITPTYRRPEKLKEAVESVLSQSFSDFEYLVVNNDEYPIEIELVDPRIRLIHEKRKGANYARNTGIEIACGEFICFLDDDDIYLSNHLEELHKLIQLKNKQIGLYRTFTQIKDKFGSLSQQEINCRPQNFSNLDHLYTEMLTMHCVCLHKIILTKFKFDPKIKVAQDYHLWTKILSEFDLYEAPVITTQYNISSNSISTASKDKYLSYLDVYSELFKSPFTNNLNPKIKSKRLFTYHNFLLESFSLELGWRQFLKHCLKSFKLKPTALNFWRIIIVIFKKLIKID